MNKSFKIVVLLSLVCVPSFAGAHSYAGHKWPSNAVTVDFSSSSIPSTWISPISLGMSPWNATTSPFTFSAGTSSHAVTVSSLGTGNPLAITTTSFSGSTITDNDLVFNSSFTWSTSGAAGAFDVQNVATHEFGHFLSLNDLSGVGDTDKTMYYTVATGETKKRTLDTDDINGINAIYP